MSPILRSSIFEIRLRLRCNHSLLFYSEFWYFLYVMFVKIFGWPELGHKIYKKSYIYCTYLVRQGISWAYSWRTFGVLFYLISVSITLSPRYSHNNNFLKPNSVVIFSKICEFTFYFEPNWSWCGIVDRFLTWTCKNFKW